MWNFHKKKTIEQINTVIEKRAAFHNHETAASKCAMKHKRIKSEISSGEKQQIEYKAHQNILETIVNTTDRRLHECGNV